MSLLLQIPPDPKVPGEPERRAETRRRRRMLDGDWREEAEDRLADFFAAEIREFLPDAELSRNAAANYTTQLATLYDEPYTVDVLSEDGETAQPVEVGGDLLACQQDLLRYVIGCNDAALRLDPHGEGDDAEVYYRVVTLDLLYVEVDAKDPDRVVYVEEDRPRAHPDTGETVWTKERWDVRGEAPAFSIVHIDGQGAEHDLTAAYGFTGWPEGYTKADGSPIIPYVLYHRYVSARWATPYRGSELFEGTLTVAALWTMWVAGVRDGAFPARVVIDGKIDGGTVERSGSLGGSTKAHVINPLAVLSVTSKGENRQASVTQFQPSLDPKAAGEALEQFEAGLAVHAGLSATDVARGSSGQSGYSIVVSRDGQRRQQARLRVPMAKADAHRCAMAAAMINRIAPGSEQLPEESSRYRVLYAPLPQTPEEVTADLARVTALTEAGLMTRTQAYMEMHVGVDEETARAALAEIDAEKPKPPPVPVAVPPAQMMPDKEEA